MLLRFKELTTIPERQDARERLQEIREHYYDITLEIANLWAEHIKDPEMQKESELLSTANDAMAEKVDKVIDMLTENNDGGPVPNADS